jgi:cobaltochelatase CobN
MATVIEHGVACCEHTCNNPAFQQYATDILNTPGLVNPVTLIQYAEVLKAATGKSLNERKAEMDRIVLAQASLSKPVPGSIEQRTDTGQTPDKEKIEKADEWKSEDEDSEKSEIVKGLEMEEIKTNEVKLTINQSNTPWIVVAVALGCSTFFVYGWVRKKF